MILHLSLELPEDQDFLRLVRVLGTSTLEYLEVSPDDVVDTELVLGELCSNVCRHARSEDGRYRLDLEYHADRLVVTVTDRGPGFSPEALPPPGAERPDGQGGTRMGGFGLAIVGDVADRLEFRPVDGAGMSVRAEKRLTYRSRTAEEQAESLDARGGPDGAGAVAGARGERKP